MKIRLALGMALLALMAVIFAACGGEEEGVLSVPKVDRAPAGGTDSLWKDKARSMTFTNVGAAKFEGGEVDVTMQGLRTDTEIFLKFVWNDAEPSMVKGTWEFDGESWSALPGNEDRLAVLWQIDRIDNFATKGCTVACHSDAAETGDWYFAADSGKGDIWHWKSYRTDPLNFADDGFLTAGTDESASGHHKDEGGGGDTRNRNEAEDGPSHMPNLDMEQTLPGFLLTNEAIEIDVSLGWAPGTQIPQRMLSQPSGDRGHITADATYANGQWTLILSRQLNTGSADDLELEAGRTYTIGVAVFNDSGDEDSYNSDPIQIKL